MNRKNVNEFILKQWYSMVMVVHGESISLENADGWFASEDEIIIGLITYRIVNSEMEILSLDSLKENKGIGTSLLNKAVEAATNSGCSRIMLITTNDNLNALQFYQKRGFDIVKLHINAVEQSRKIKPEIPLIGFNGIPIRHEIELEMKFQIYKSKRKSLLFATYR
jgi:GNAT superfamily N-acetyltransferase